MTFEWLALWPLVQSGLTTPWAWSRSSSCVSSSIPNFLVLMITSSNLLLTLKYYETVTDVSDNISLIHWCTNTQFHSQCLNIIFQVYKYFALSAGALLHCAESKPNSLLPLILEFVCLQWAQKVLSFAILYINHILVYWNFH